MKTHTPRTLHRPAVLSLALGMLALLGFTATARADDVKVQPAPGSGFVVTDKTAATERFKVKESGEVTVPGLLAAPSIEAQPLCFNIITGRLGSCSAVGGGSGLTDNGDGTVTDHATGLVWEKKTGTFGSGVDCSTTTCSDPHGLNNYYKWSASGTAPDGGVFTDFLERVNGKLCASSTCPGLGGHSDWRVPTLSELQTIVDATQGGCGGGEFEVPCINPIFGPTAPEGYWTASTEAGHPSFAWILSFNSSGGSAGLPKTITGFYTRAVRGGL
jgi:hypothetical protein